jgi:signal transduction histidine kinase
MQATAQSSPTPAPPSALASASLVRFLPIGLILLCAVAGLWLGASAIVRSAARDKDAVLGIAAGALLVLLSFGISLQIASRVCPMLNWSGSGLTIGWRHVTTPVETAPHETQELLHATLDALTTRVALLDPEAKIVAINVAWRSYTRGAVHRHPDCGVGRNYLELCDGASGDWPVARRIAEGVRAVLSGRRDECRIDYECSAGGDRRSFQLRITRFLHAGGLRVVLAIDDITEAKLAEAALREVTGRLLKLQDQERRRIARELHDSTAQNLFSATLGIGRALRLAPALPAAARDALDESRELIEQSQQEIRTVSYLLHPPMLDAGGLPSTLRWYVAGFAERSGIAVALDIAPELTGRRFAADAETALFRVVQEALANVSRHSKSATARIGFRSSKSAENEEIVLTIEDDGIGMIQLPIEHAFAGTKPRTASIGVGLPGMQERLRQLGGHLDIHSRQDGGTTIRARVRLTDATTIASTVHDEAPSRTGV